MEIALFDCIDVYCIIFFIRLFKTKSKVITLENEDRCVSKHNINISPILSVYSVLSSNIKFLNERLLIQIFPILSVK